VTPSEPDRLSKLAWNARMILYATCGVLAFYLVVESGLGWKQFALFSLIVLLPLTETCPACGRLLLKDGGSPNLLKMMFVRPKCGECERKVARGAEADS
jgi:hypothetical protein